jgi:Ca2+-binding EF-hand superfamily protein
LPVREQKIASLRESFAKADVDGSGSLSGSEIEGLIREVTTAT